MIFSTTSFVVRPSTASACVWAIARSQLLNCASLSTRSVSARTNPAHGNGVSPPHVKHGTWALQNVSNPSYFVLMNSSKHSQHTKCLAMGSSSFRQQNPVVVAESVKQTQQSRAISLVKIWAVQLSLMCWMVCSSASRRAIRKSATCTLSSEICWLLFSVSDRIAAVRMCDPSAQVCTNHDKNSQDTARWWISVISGGIPAEPFRSSYGTSEKPSPPKYCRR